MSTDAPSPEDLLLGASALERTPAPAGSRSRVISQPERHDIGPVPWMQDLPPTMSAPQGFLSGQPRLGQGSERSPSPENAHTEQLQAKVRELEAKLDQAQTQQPQLLHDASQRGRQEAEQAAQARLEQEVQPWLLRLAQTIEDLLTTKRRFIEDSEEQVVRLSVAIARRILHREIQVDPEALLGLLRAALTKSELREVHRVLLPTAYMVMYALSPVLPDLLARLSVEARWGPALGSVWIAARVGTFTLLERWHGWHGRWSRVSGSA